MASARLPSRRIVFSSTPCSLASASAVLSGNVDTLPALFEGRCAAFFVLLYLLPRSKLRWSGVRLRNVSNGVGFIRRKLRRITRWTPRDSWRQIAATLAVIFWELSTLSQFATKSLIAEVIAQSAHIS